MVNWNILVFAELDAIELVGNHKHSVANIVEREVWTDNIVVEVVFLLAEGFAVVAPVARFELEVSTFSINHLLVFGCFFLSLCKCRSPNLHQKFVNSFGSLCHVVVEDVCSVRLVTENVSLFQA